MERVRYFLPFEFQKFIMFSKIFFKICSSNNDNEHGFILPFSAIIKPTLAKWCEFMEFSPECYFNLMLLLHYGLSTKLLTDSIGIWKISALYSYTFKRVIFKSVIFESIKIKIFSKSIKMIQIIISENIWKWDFWKCHSSKCQNWKCKSRWTSSYTYLLVFW